MNPQHRIHSRARAIALIVPLVFAFGCFEHPTFGPEIEGYPDNINPSIPGDCVDSVPNGTTAFKNMALAGYPSTRNLGTLRDCDAGGFWRSKHKAGRAFDWGLNVNNSTEKSIADGFIIWLRDTDVFGNKHEKARRLGIAEMIWNLRVWSTSQSPDYKGASYGGANPHTDHIHIGFSHAGAIGFTTWWLPAASCDQTPGWYWNGSNCRIDFGF